MGITIKRVVPGDGMTYPLLGDTVTIHYIGKLPDGTVFDSSRAYGKSPFTTQLGCGNVIPAWDVGLRSISLGETAVITATPDYAYGERGFLPAVPKNATLSFEVQLLKIN